MGEFMKGGALYKAVLGKIGRNVQKFFKRGRPV